MSEAERIEFDVKYGHNVINVPIKEVTHFASHGMSELWKDKVTIFNDIPAQGNNARTWHRCVISLCNIQGGITQKLNGQTLHIANGKMIISKDVTHYKAPNEFDTMSDRDGFYTLRTNDFVVFGEVADTVTTQAQFTALKQKYKDSGFSIVTYNVNIHGMDVDNITILNA